MADDRLRRHIRGLEEGAVPDADFADGLYRRLGRLQSRPRWLPERPWQYAAIVAVAVAAIGAGAALGALIGNREVALGPSASPSPSASSPPTPSFTATPTSTSSGVPTAAPAATPTPKPTATATATAEPAPTLEPQPTPIAGSWHLAAPMPPGPAISDAALGADGRIYVFVFGDGQTAVRVYDQRADQWSLEEPTALPGPRVFHGELTTGWGYDSETEVAAGGDGLLYVTSGAAGPEFYISAYDPETRAWEHEHFEHEYFVFDAASGADGRIYLLTDGSEILTFDPWSRTLTSGAVVERGFNDLVPARDGELIAFDEFGGPVASYDVPSGTWRELGELPENTILVADRNGWMYALLSGSRAVAYGPDYEFAPMPQPPNGFSATHLLVGEDGRVYAFGGSDGRVAIFTPER